MVTSTPLYKRVEKVECCRWLETGEGSESGFSVIFQVWQIVGLFYFPPSYQYLPDDQSLRVHESNDQVVTY